MISSVGGYLQLYILVHLSVAVAVAVAAGADAAGGGGGFAKPPGIPPTCTAASILRDQASSRGHLNFGELTTRSHNPTTAHRPTAHRPTAPPPPTHRPTTAPPATRHAKEHLLPLDRGVRAGPDYRLLCDLAIVNHSLVLVGAGKACYESVVGKGPPNEIDIHYYAGTIVNMLARYPRGTVPDVRLRIHSNECGPINRRSSWLTWCNGYPNKLSYEPLTLPAFHDAPCYTLSQEPGARSRRRIGEWGSATFTVRDVMRSRQRRKDTRAWADRIPSVVWRGSSTGTREGCAGCRLRYGFDLRPNRHQEDPQVLM